MGKLRWSFLIFVLVGLFTLGCASKISQENYNKIKVGMSVAEVNKILGEPTQVTTIAFGDVVGTHAVWEDRNGTLSIQYFNGLVKLKSYTKGVTRPRD